MSSNPYPAPGEEVPDHPLAQLFPMMEAESLIELALDIKEYKQREPIVLYEGKVLDGRNRRNACKKANVEPFYRLYDPRTDGKSPLQFVISANLRRRQLTTSQLAAVAVDVIPLYEAETKKKQAAAGTAKAGNLKQAAAPSIEEPRAPALTGSAPAPAAPATGSLVEKNKVEALLLQAKCSLPVYRKCLETGQHPNGKKVTAADRADLEKRIEDCQAVLDRWGDEFDQRTPGGDADTAPPPEKPSKPAKATKPAAAAKTPGAKKTATAPQKPAELPPADPEPKGPMCEACGEEDPDCKPWNDMEHVCPECAGRAPTAVEQAAETMGVSGTIVKDAKTLQEQAPEKFAEVKAGTKTVHAAKKEAERESPEVVTAIARISQICGKSLGEAVQDGTRLKKTKDILEYASLPDDEMIRLRGLIDSGWNLKEAKAYKDGKLTRAHKIGDLLTRAAANGGTFLLEIDGYRVDVSLMTKLPKA